MQKKRSEEIIIIKKNSDFIYKNGSMIMAKLNNPRTHAETLNNLQTILLGYNASTSDENIYVDLIQGDEEYIVNTDPYFFATSVIFRLCEEINASNRCEEEKSNLRDILRQYTKFFKRNENPLYNNNEALVILSKDDKTLTKKRN